MRHGGFIHIDFSSKESLAPMRFRRQLKGEKGPYQLKDLIGHWLSPNLGGLVNQDFDAVIDQAESIGLW